MKQRKIADIAIGDFARLLNGIVRMVFGNNQIAPLTAPVTAVLDCMTGAYNYYNRAKSVPGHEQEKADLVHAFIRNEELWAEFEYCLFLYVKECLATANDVINALSRASNSSAILINSLRRGSLGSP